jgi:Holliday junction resolvase RusA-like endonuclease
MNDRWFVLSINPDPWAIGPLGVGKRNGKMFPYVGRNTQLDSYKQAIKEELREIEPLPQGDYELNFYFWRRLDEHGSGRKHIADATNMQKATEDALQDVLFDNDRNVRDIRSVVVEQDSDTTPCVVIRARLWQGLNPEEIPEHVWEQVDHTETTPLFDNTWGGPNS